MDMAILHNARRAFVALSTKVDDYVIERQLRKLGVGHARRIRTHTTREELHALFRLARQCPPGANALEIGSYLGASTCYIAAGLAQHGGRLFCADTWLNETMSEVARDTFAQFSANTEPLSRWIITIRKRSEDLVAGDVRASLDLVFIDGDHSYAAANADFRFAARLLSDGGVIAFHDARYFPGVSRVVGEALASGHWRLAGCVYNLCWVQRAPEAWVTTAQPSVRRVEAA
jgi:predicted O-methyltransferase YrrM